MEILLLQPEEQALRLEKVRGIMNDKRIDALLISDNANKYYLTGRVFSGYIYLPLKGEPIYFVKRPVTMKGDGVVSIRKPEQIAESIGMLPPATIGLELATASYSKVERLRRIFPQSELADASSVMSAARAVKTAEELEKIRISGIKQDHVYRKIPTLYTEGMTDVELQVEIERESRLEGCLGQFRINGDDMELYMGNILVGDNADVPTPYDFAMGGEGMDPSLPVGCNGTVIKPGNSVMVDVNGNYTGYMTDMTRTYYVEEIGDLARKAHECSIAICHRLAELGRPGTEAKALYEEAEKMAREAGLHEYFMGHRQKAGFVGHGVGIEINELPVIAPRSRDILQENNVIALEPKFVIPKTGAIGIENTYVVTPDGLKPLTNTPEGLTSLT
ncbi:MAG: aminopeptidase P family protein [Muribaculaceae bacterium]|nr:aminopeptidase P family protein [Muribaculaceae bacterium]